MSYNINALRLCSDIGMWALDRSRETCRFATKFCAEHCYNKKLYRVYSAMEQRDDQNENYWHNTYTWDIAKDINKAMEHKKGSGQRFRFCTRGEALGTLSDIIRVTILAEKLPNVLFWIPTRAWRSYDTTGGILERSGEKYDLLMRAKLLPNLRIMASVDPTTTPDERNMLHMHGWSTISFGVPVEDRHFLCPKTHGGIKGACATCADGCFAAHQTHVHLKEH